MGRGFSLARRESRGCPLAGGERAVRGAGGRLAGCGGGFAFRRGRGRPRLCPPVLRRTQGVIRGLSASRRAGGIPSRLTGCTSRWVLRREDGASRPVHPAVGRARREGAGAGAVPLAAVCAGLIPHKRGDRHRDPPPAYFLEVPARSALGGDWAGFGACLGCQHPLPPAAFPRRLDGNAARGNGVSGLPTRRQHSRAVGRPLLQRPSIPVRTQGLITSHSFYEGPGG
ncbi:uncharacterized protein LOC119141153 isoform X2 [Falco rusticolus]|uniref:uncharacterized protein LOC119141153 isoform X2 n=1 Tax=Falco rusticolus TaxID=120794 RepID=UPI00188675B0|nr:uncharacterized protein LOC119141153 isoform X2 [Falco rusticolus]